MLRYVPDQIKTKKMCKQAAEKLPFVIRYVLNPKETQELCGKTIVENSGMLMFFPECYKNKKMRNKAVDNYAHVLMYYNFSLIAIHVK